MSDDIVLSNEYLEAVEKYLEERGKPVCLKTGFRTLDGLVGGMEGGEVWIISGTPKAGKTLLLKTFLRNLSEQEVMCCVFQYEVNPYKFLKSMENPSGSIPIFALPTTIKDHDLKWLDTMISKAIKKYKAQVIFIDHLHFLVDLMRHNISIEIGSVMRRLKKMALTHNVVIFLVAHTVKAKPDTELDMSDIRDSGLIAAESDTILFIWRTKKPHNGSVLKIAADRKNGTITKIELVKTGLYLEEVKSHA